MLPSKTVFIVGAGASHEVGLPIGSGLKTTIASKLDFSFDDFGRELKRGDPSVFNVLHRAYGNRINECVDACRLISKGIVLSSSIDDFIDAHQHDEGIALSGKVAIARSILEAERNSSLFYDRSNIYNTIDFAGVQGTWFSGFFQLLIQQVRKNNVADLLANVAIVSFNYDRCIEHFLVHAIATHYNLQAPESQALVQDKLKIFHPYGSVGPYFGPQSVEFGFRGIPPIEQVVKSLRTYTEQLEDEKELAPIRQAVSEAETLVFLGNAFHANNMNVLSLGKANLDTKRMFATRKGISDADLKVVDRRLLRLYRAGSPHPSDKQDYGYADTCRELFEKYRMSLRE